MEKRKADLDAPAAKRVDVGDVREWSEDQVSQFLIKCNLDILVEPFKDELIDGMALVLLKEADLMELGVPLGPRRKFAAELETLCGSTVEFKSPAAKELSLTEAPEEDEEPAPMVKHSEVISLVEDQKPFILYFSGNEVCLGKRWSDKYETEHYDRIYITRWVRTGERTWTEPPDNYSDTTLYPKQIMAEFDSPVLSATDYSKYSVMLAKNGPVPVVKTFSSITYRDGKPTDADLKPYVAYLSGNGWELGKHYSDRWSVEDTDPDYVHLKRWENTQGRYFRAPDGGRNYEVNVLKTHIIGEFSAVHPLSRKNFNECNQKAAEHLERFGPVPKVNRYTSYEYPFSEHRIPQTDGLTLNEEIVTFKSNNETYVYLPQFCRALGVRPPKDLLTATKGVIDLDPEGIKAWEVYIKFAPNEVPRAWRLYEVARYWKRHGLLVPKKVQKLFDAVKQQHLASKLKK